MKIDEAIRTAIDYEIKVRDVYLDAAGRAGDPIGRRVFALLGQEEQNHVSYLEARLAGWRESGRLCLDDIGSLVPPIDRIREAAASLAARLGGPGPAPEAELLERARQVEIETSDYYQRMVDSLEADEREFFARFLEIERGHLAIVDAELTAVKGLGYWFDMPEFDLEAG
jgi:rubrerythrin